MLYHPRLVKFRARVYLLLSTTSLIMAIITASATTITTKTFDICRIAKRFWTEG